MPPRLVTLGQLKLSELDFKREKPLLLVYLCLSGTQLRRRVAQHFWPDAADFMNSLAGGSGAVAPGCSRLGKLTSTRFFPATRRRCEKR
ncbi:hypothetical protein [Deinococcus alpinitundrae]|uniref:hypothetical protein n=1 Tax=Deinococcus alpinitundrae TaxID=468913 RepID=UPI001379A107|nr:hypothetical protein [Deinococcus alpinitundrae]